MSRAIKSKFLKVAFVSVSFLFTLVSCNKNDGIGVRSTGTMPIKSESDLQVYYIKFTYLGDNCILLWKGRPGIEITTDQNNNLKSVSHKDIKFTSIGAVNLLSNDSKIEPLIDDNAPYSEEIQKYNINIVIDKMYLIEK